MERLHRYLAVNPRIARRPLDLVLVILAACNNGSDSGGGPGGY